MPAFIDDGYTESVFIPEMAGQYERVSLSFRPVATEGVSEYSFLTKDKNHKEAKRITAEFLTKRILSWDVKNGTADVAVSPENLLKLNVHLFDEIFAIVFCQKNGMKEQQEKKSGN